MTDPLLEPFEPPTRLLMGPGPINAHPSVLAAMAAPLVGQFDPAMTGAMQRVMALYRRVFRTANDATFLVDGTARAGIEALLVSLIEPGDRVLVPVIGRFGHLLAEIAERCGAEVHVVEVPWGEVVPDDLLAAAIERVRPALVATVQGDTSTTMRQPLEGLGRSCREHDALLYVDVTASLGGNPFEMDEWSVDAASAGLQKCLGGPSGSAPVSLSPTAVERVRGRRRIEAGLREPTDADEPLKGTVIRSNYFDVAMLLDYWGERRLNHHTEATSMLYAALECARLLLVEGIDEAVARHRRHGEAVRAELLDRHGIEIGTSFGPLHGRIWRIGTMGRNAREEAILSTLDALEAVLRRSGGVDAAQARYAAAAG